MGQPDAALITAAQAGDRRAIDELLARYEEPIYRFGLRMCGDEESAREVLQETMLAAFRNLPGFRGQAALSTWLYQIARSFCIKERRRAPPTTPLDAVAPAQVPAPDMQVHARQIGQALAEAVASLPTEQREALVLRDVEGLSAQEAADVVGVEIGALKSRLHRARMALRTRLASHELACTEGVSRQASVTRPLVEWRRAPPSGRWRSENSGTEAREPSGAPLPRR